MLHDIHLSVVVWKEGNSYVSKCPELNLASCGDSVQEARLNLKEAIELYIENAKLLDMYDDIKQSLFSTEKYTSTLALSA